MMPRRPPMQLGALHDRRQRAGDYSRRRQNLLSLSLPSSVLWKRQRLALRRRHPKDVEDHGYQHVISEDAHEFHGGGIAEDGMDPLEILFAHASRPVELRNEIVDRTLILGC